ncbi:MAG: hypothetical protein HYT50_01185 [Candidatus Wildermuthbacteria bacterium]|nr:hypothetical protein [Candidatus Wildermuthbacteria bacterium]
MKKYIVAAVAVLGTAGVAAASLYAGVLDPSWNPFRPAPEIVLAKMLENSKDVESARTKATIVATQRQEGKDLFTVSLVIDDQNNNSKESQGTFTASLSAEGVNYSLTGEYKGNQETVYVRFTTIPAFPLISLYLGTDADSLKDQWIRIENEKSVASEEEEKLINDLVDILAKSLRVQELPDENVQGQNTYHYRVPLTEEALRKLVAKINEFANTLESIEGDSYAEETDYEEIVQLLKDMPIELWIGKKDKLPYQISIEKDIDMRKLDPGEDGTLSLKIQLQMSEYDKEVKIEFPRDSKTFEEILGDIYGDIYDYPELDY